MNAKDKLKIFKEFQETKIHHPLTCSKNSRHELLVYNAATNELICLECNYKQKVEDDFIDIIAKIIRGYKDFQESNK